MMSFKQNHSSFKTNSIILQTIEMFFAVSIMHITVGYNFVFKMVKKGNEKNFKKCPLLFFLLDKQSRVFLGKDS